MSQRRVQVVILCEDRQQEVFARYFLEKRGFKGPMRTKICPPASQSGEQYVRERYPLEVKAYRQNRNRVSICLVVLIDADTNTTKTRYRELSKSLTGLGECDRQQDEAIAIFIPKRNIETWLHYLRGEAVNEDKAYSKSKEQSSCRADVENLAEQCRSQGLPEEAPASLRLACRELERLLPLLKP